VDSCAGRCGLQKTSDDRRLAVMKATASKPTQDCEKRWRLDNPAFAERGTKKAGESPAVN